MSATQNRPDKMRKRQITDKVKDMPVSHFQAMQILNLCERAAEDAWFAACGTMEGFNKHFDPYSREI